MLHLHHPAPDSWALSLTIVLSILAFIYISGWAYLRTVRSNTIAAWRAGCFVFGLFLIWLAVASPMAPFDHELLTVHMAGHLLLMTIAPCLIWLGEPTLAFVHGLPAPAVGRAIKLLRWSPLRRLRNALASFAFCWLAAAITLVGWHVPALFTLGMRSLIWHGIEQASFIFSGLVFWWPVIRPWPSVAKSPDWLILYLFLATLPCDVLSGFLVFCDRPVYETYFSGSRPFLTSALEDQQCAGALMWTSITLIYLVAGTVLAVRLLAPQSSGKRGSVQLTALTTPAHPAVEQIVEAL